MDHQQKLGHFQKHKRQFLAGLTGANAAAG